MLCGTLWLQFEVRRVIPNRDDQLFAACALMSLFLLRRKLLSTAE
jgi:hypothetical protein